MIPTKILAIAVLCALAVVAVPADGFVVGSAEAVVCDVDDVECHERQLRCYVRAVLEGGACPR